MTTLGATGNGQTLSSYMKYLGNGDYEVKLYRNKKWRKNVCEVRRRWFDQFRGCAR